MELNTRKQNKKHVLFDEIGSAFPEGRTSLGVQD